MSRPLRLRVPGLHFHVMARGNARMTIFDDEVAYQRFLSLVADACDRWRLTCGAYCLMPNHYHLIVRTDEPTLSDAMRHMNGVYAQWFNRRHGRVGHVLQGRFKAQAIQHTPYLLTVARYVARNPVRSGLVERAEDWPWSSYRATVGLGPGASWLSTRLVLEACGADNHHEAVARFKGLVAEPEVDEPRVVEDAVAGDPWQDACVVGDPTFAAMFAPDAQVAGQDIARRDRLLGRPPLALLVSTSVRGPLLAAQARRAHDAFGYSFREVARHAGLHREALRRLLRADGRGSADDARARHRAPAADVAAS
jgi:putative transposase